MKIRIGQRLISAILAVSMMIGVMPVSAFADVKTEAEPSTAALEQENDAGDIIVIDRWNITSGSDDDSWSYKKNNFGKYILTLKKGVFQLDLDMDPQATMRIEKDATLLGCTGSYTIKCGVDNDGTIEGGTFTGPSEVWIKNGSTSTLQKVGGGVGNGGVINGGTFKGNVQNGISMSVSKVDPTTGYINGGTFWGKVTNYGTITGNAEIAYNASNKENNSGGVLNYGVIGGSTFTDCKISTVSDNGYIFGVGTFRGISGGIFKNCTISKNGDNIASVIGGTFVGCTITGQAINGGIFDHNVGRGIEVKAANGTDTFSLIQNGNDNVSGVLTNVSALYVVPTVETIPTASGYTQEIEHRNFVISPSVAVVNVNGDVSKRCKAGENLALSTADAQNAKILLNFRKNLSADDFHWDETKKCVVSDVEGIGTITTYFNGKEEIPTDSGDYKITYKVAESDTYYAFEGPEDTGWVYQIPYKITVVGGMANIVGGKMDVKEAKTGEKILFTIGTSPAGKQFRCWLMDGEPIGSENFDVNHCFIMPARNVEIRAAYDDILYDVTVKGGTAEPEHAIAGTTITLTHEPAETGKVFSHWNVNTDKIEGNTFKMPIGGAEAIAVYKDIDYKVTVEDGKATINGKTATTGHYRDNVVLQPVDKSSVGKKFDHWELADGSETVTIENNTFVMPAGNVAIRAVYQDIPYGISVKGGKALVDGTESKTAFYGQQVTLVPDAAETGKEFESWSVEADSTVIQITDGSFIMPAGEVGIQAVYKQSTYQISIEGGEVLVKNQPATSAHYNDLVHLTEKPDKIGDTLDYWEINGQRTTEHQFRMPAEDVTIKAFWKRADYRIDLKNAAATVNGKDASTAQYQQEVTLTAVRPAYGKEFVGWELTGLENVSGLDTTKETLKFLMPANGITAKAIYKDGVYTIKIIGGRAESFKTKAKANEIIRIFPDDLQFPEGQEFKEWYSTPKLTIDHTDNGYTFVMPAENVVIEAKYRNRFYALTVNETKESKEYSSSITVTAEDKPGQTFTGWTVDGVTVANKNSKTLSFQMPANDVTLTANYSANSYTLTVNGKAEQKAYGTNIEVTAEDKEGQTFTGWTVSGVEVVDKSGKTLSFQMPANDVNLTANYQDIPKPQYTLTVEGGTPASTTAEAGTEVTLTANTPAEGKLFDQWELSENLTLISGSLTDETITVRMPEGNATAKATYKDAPKPEYTLTVTSGTPASTTAEAGTEVTLTANTPAEGKLFDQWELSENLTLISGSLTDETITVRMPEGNATAKATYKDAPKPEYTLTVTSGTPASTTAEAGTEVTLTANTPAEGKLFDQWELSENLTLISGNLTDETITVRMPEGNATAKATYKDAPKPEPEPYTIEVQDGTAFVNGAEAAAALAGTEITIHAKAAPEGMKFSGWQVETPQTLELKDGTAAKTTFIMPDACVKISALYTTSEVPDPTPDASGGGAAIAAAAVGAAAGAAIGIGVWAVNRYILSNLPVGMAVPTTRQQLAVVLWTMAGKPDVTPTVHYQDVAGLDAQKAVHWAVEQQLMQPESAEYFGTQGSVNKWQVFQLMKQVVKQRTIATPNAL